MTPRLPNTQTKRRRATSEDSPRESTRATSGKRTGGESDFVPIGEATGTPNPDAIFDEVPFTAREKRQAKDLKKLYTLMAVISRVIHKDISAGIFRNAEEAAVEWVILSRRSSSVKSAIDSLTAASVWGSIVSIHADMLMPGLAIPTVGNMFTQERERVFEMPAAQPDSDIMDMLAGMGVSPDQAAQAYDMAMAMMAGQAVSDNGGPTDTVRVQETNGGPIGSAEYQPPPIPLDEYPFPIDASPPNGGS